MEEFGHKTMNIASLCFLYGENGDGVYAEDIN